MVRKWLSFFKHLFFPILCYGCRSPGRLLCQSCFSQLELVKSSERCEHCFHFVQSMTARICSQCSPSSSRRSHHMYRPTVVSLSLYSQASGGKEFALHFFVRMIIGIWSLQGYQPKRILYPISHLSVDLVRALSNATRIPYQGIFLHRRWCQSLSIEGPICLLSAYPLPRRWQERIERCSKQRVIFMSLFLQEMH